MTLPRSLVASLSPRSLLWSSTVPLVWWKKLSSVVWMPPSPLIWRLAMTWTNLKFVNMCEKSCAEENLGFCWRALLVRSSVHYNIFDKTGISCSMSLVKLLFMLTFPWRCSMNKQIEVIMVSMSILTQPVPGSCRVWSTSWSVMKWFWWSHIFVALGWWSRRSWIESQLCLPLHVTR